MAKSPTEQIRELAVQVGILLERDEFRTNEVDRLRDSLADEREARTALERELAGLRQENAVLRQQLQDHIKQTELRDSRRWALTVALIGVLVGALMSLASGVILTFARR